MKKLGIAISLYNRLPELLTNINIIRKHWNPEYRDAIIGVCSNNRETFEQLKLNKDIDVLTPGNFDIPSSPKPYKRCRQFDTISSSIMATADKCEYVVHWHADFFATNSLEIYKIIHEMEKRLSCVGFRGRGLDYKTDKNVFGDFDDHCFILNSQQIIERKLFDCPNILEFLSICNIESFIAKLVQDKFSRSEIHQYSDMRECEVDMTDPRPDPFYSDNIMHRNMLSFNCDRARNFIHSGDQKISRKFLLEFGVPEDLIAFGKEKEEDKTFNDWLNG